VIRDVHDAIVIGAGFGGLGAALSLAEKGARVRVCEALTYPGGCASTFDRGGYRFEAGATLLAGFDEGQLFRRWIDEHELDITVDQLDPVVELRAPGLSLDIPASRAELFERLCRLPGAPRERLRAFFDHQESVAAALWELLDDSDLLPPLDARALLRHAARLPRTLSLLRIAGRPLTRVLRRFGLEEFAPLRLYLDALCQITVQCGVEEAEAPFALATMDYFFRGCGDVRGGIGNLAWGLVEALRRLGVDVRFGERAYCLDRAGEHWRVRTRGGEVRARHVIANLLPQGVRKLLREPVGKIPRLDRAAARVEEGWGACMLYLVARAPADAGPRPRHIQIVQDRGAPLIEGNHLFCSISGEADEGRAPTGLRTITVSTHVPMVRMIEMCDDERGAYVDEIQTRMREGLLAALPQWYEASVYEMTASPRTFERFTSRVAGYVGGVPRRAGLGHYRMLFPRPFAPKLHLVGDSVLLGQSALATAVGGTRVAERVARALGIGAALRGHGDTGDDRDPALECTAAPASPARPTRPPKQRLRPCS
jgi:phytoene dehydrogenase-like protein